MKLSNGTDNIGPFEWWPLQHQAFGSGVFFEGVGASSELTAALKCRFDTRR